MLEKLHLNNFRGFSNHTVPFHELTIVIGENNAGKSSIVEALRLVGLATERYKSSVFHDTPDWVPDSGARGFKPSLRGISINLDTISHQYSDDPSKIVATFENKSSISIYLQRNEGIFIIVRDTRRHVVQKATDSRFANLPPVKAMPQISPVLRNEELIGEDTVWRNQFTYLTSRNFRNQLHYASELFDEFKSSVENSWQGVTLTELILDGKYLNLQVRNEGFVGELALMGHGLQMWLQTIWFLVRCNSSDIIILDEPDVYLHADLQRKLIRRLFNNYNQVIVMTHSVEIISEVDANNLLIVNKRQESSIFTDDYPAVQNVIGRLGSVHNIQLARLTSAQCYLLVEGYDISFLRPFQNSIYPTTLRPIEALPNSSIGGWGGWTVALNTPLTLQNTTGDRIKVYCLLDKDYHCDSEIAERYKQAKTAGIELLILHRKEIENYLLVPDAIARLVGKELGLNIDQLSIEIHSKIAEIAGKFEDEVLDGLSDSLQTAYREKKSNANKAAREYIKKMKSNDQFHYIVSGKKLFALLSNEIHKTYKYSLRSMAVANELAVSEIAPEIKELIKALEQNNPISTNFKTLPGLTL